MGIAGPNGGTRQQEARRPGRVIPFGKYLLLDRIAVGGMAEVYLAKSFGIEGFEKMLAIKRILPTMAEDQEFIEMFVDEAKIAGQLTHANIVPIFELGKIGDSHYIAMEYVWGKDLLQIMNRFRRLRKRMPPAMVAWIATKMCEALDYAHTKRDRRGQPMNIIHRDVSPQNVLISYEGEVKLIDFGIAKAASRTTKTQAGVLKGKFGYMSPEQVRGMPIDHRSDIFAVGTCMYEALTSERLFLGESDFSTLEKVRNAEVVPVMQVAEVPGELNEIVMTALKRDPADRYQSASEMQDALHGYLARQGPPFGTSKLSSWLKTAFSNEMQREKAKLDSFAHIGRPSVLAGPRKAPGLPRTTVGRPSVKRPPPRQPSNGGAAAPPPLPRPAASHTTSELGDSDLDVDALDDVAGLEGEATMVTASPFEEAAEAGGEVGDEINEEPTRIFFSSEDIEEIDDEAAAPAGGFPSSQPPAPLQATFRPGEPPDVRLSNPPVGARDPSRSPAPPVPPAPAPMPPRGTPPAAVGAGGRPGPGLPPPAPPQVVPRQRQLATMEMISAGRDPAVVEAQRIAHRQRAESRRTIALAVVAAVAMLGVGVVGALRVFGGDDVGTIEVRTVPSVGATVTIDGVPRGRAPLRVERIRSGRRVIEIRADGYPPATREVEVQPGAVAMLEVALGSPAAAAPGEAVAQAGEGEGEAAAGPVEEPGGRAEEGNAEESTTAGDEAEETPEQESASSTKEPPPPTKVVAEQETRRPGETQRHRETTEQPQRAPSGSGTLVINTIPWARVFLDGRDTGRNTPITGIPVRSGTRTIGLRTPDGQMHEFQVQVEPGATVRLMKRL